MADNVHLHTIHENLQAHGQILVSLQAAIVVHQQSLKNLALQSPTLDGTVYPLLCPNAAFSSIPPPIPTTTTISNTYKPLARSIRLDFPRFDGSDAVEWVFKAEEFFDYYGVDDSQRLSISSFHMDGVALQWFRWLSQNHQLRSWSQFTQALEARFAPMDLECCHDSTTNLMQTSSVVKEKATVDFLVNYTSVLPEKFLLNCNSGLRSDIKHEKLASKPTTMTPPWSTRRLYPAHFNHQHSLPLPNFCNFPFQTLPTQTQTTPNMQLEFIIIDCLLKLCGMVYVETVFDKILKRGFVNFKDDLVRVKGLLNRLWWIPWGVNVKVWTTSRIRISTDIQWNKLDDIQGGNIVDHGVWSVTFYSSVELYIRYCFKIVIYGAIHRCWGNALMLYEEGDHAPQGIVGIVNVQSHNERSQVAYVNFKDPPDARSVYFKVRKKRRFWILTKRQLKGNGDQRMIAIVAKSRWALKFYSNKELYKDHKIALWKAADVNFKSAIVLVTCDISTFKQSLKQPGNKLKISSDIDGSKESMGISVETAGLLENEYPILMSAAILRQGRIHKMGQVVIQVLIKWDSLSLKMQLDAQQLQNLEDKVLIGEGSNVMNGPDKKKKPK